MTARRDGHDALRARLREASAAHEPDRARILARVERGMAERPGRRPAAAGRPAPAGWIRVAGTVAAVAGVLTAGGWAVTSAVRDPAPAGRAAPSLAPVPASPPTSAPTPGSSASAGTRNGPLAASGAVDPHSNAYWAQSDVTVTVSARLTSFTLRLDVARTGGVESTGAWLTLPQDDFTRTVTTTRGFLRYTWTLRRGRTVPPGEWEFAGQYNHAQGTRDAGADVYTVTGGTSDGQRGTVGDHFTGPGTDLG